jgi:hypothetical protein
MKETIYVGSFDASTQTWEVDKNGEELSPDKSLEFVSHSPTGFAWGYHGSGPSQLAFAILLEESDEKVAQTFYQQFKQEILAPMEMELPFKLTSTEIQKWLLVNESIQEFNQQNKEED